MSLLPDSASFEERVQDYFLALRGRGLSLSALDLELLGVWAASGVPFEVVARGMKQAAEGALFDARPGEPILRSLRACRRHVEAEIRKHQRATAGRAAAGRAAAGRAAAGRAEEARTEEGRPAGGGAPEGRAGGGRRKRAVRGPTSWEAMRLETLRAELAAAVLARPELGGAAGRLAGRWLREPAASPAEASLQEDAVLLHLCRALPFAERRALWRQAVVSLGDADGLGRESRKLARRVRLGALVRRAVAPAQG